MDTTSLTIDRNENVRFTLRDLFVLVTLIATILAAGRYTGTYTISIHLTMLVIGWIMHRFMHAHLAALIPCLLGSDYLAIRGVAWAYFGFEDFFDEFLSSAASILVLVGSSTFAYLATYEGRKARWQLINAVVFFALLVAWWMFVPSFGNAAVGQRQARDAAFNSAAMNKALTQVESIRKQLGRIPAEQELNDLLKESLPRVRYDSHETDIRYYRIHDRRYQLSTMVDWDIHYYDSDQPQKGWQVEPF